MNKDIVYESIDRLLGVEVRLPFLVRGTVPALYRAARGDGKPISQQIAQACLRFIERGRKRFLIISGYYEPGIFEFGESDGLYGQVVLAKAMQKLGADVFCGVEPNCLNPTKKLAEAIGLNCEIIPTVMGKDGEKENAKLEERCDAAFFIEKCGPTKMDVCHFATENPRNVDYDSRYGMFLSKMKEKGKLTVGFGDYGNEVGFGKIYEQALDITGRACNCPFNEGIITRDATDYLLPCCVSNFGAYAVISALALMTERLDILHTTEDEEKLLKAGMEAKIVDGSYAKPNNSVDGVPAPALFGYIEILKAIPTQYMVDMSGRGF